VRAQEREEEVRAESEEWGGTRRAEAGSTAQRSVLDFGHRGLGPTDQGGLGQAGEERVTVGGRLDELELLSVSP
jgi:hypothetical protein